MLQHVPTIASSYCNECVWVRREPTVEVNRSMLEHAMRQTYCTTYIWNNACDPTHFEIVRVFGIGGEVWPSLAITPSCARAWPLPPPFRPSLSLFDQPTADVTSRPEFESLQFGSHDSRGRNCEKRQSVVSEIWSCSVMTEENRKEVRVWCDGW